VVAWLSAGHQRRRGRLPAGVGPPLPHLAASKVRDVRVRVEQLWGDRRARELAERVAAQHDDGGRARELELAVRALAAGARPVDRVALEVAARLDQPRPVSGRELARAQPGPPRLAELAAIASYVDQRHLAHEVRAIMGPTPGRLCAAADV
jgi:hypothetical protein